MSGKKATGPSSQSKKKNPAPVKPTNQDTTDGGKTDSAKYLIKRHLILAGASPNPSGCTSLPEADTKHLTAAEIADLLGNPAPFSVVARGSRELLIYSSRPTTDADKAVQTQLENNIEDLASSSEFQVELKVPHARALGDLQAQLDGLNYAEFAVQTVGPDQILVSADSVPDCDLWNRFLTDLKHIAWLPSPVSPVDRVYYLSAPEVAAALNGGSASTKGSDSSGGSAPNKTADAESADTSEKSTDASKEDDSSGKQEDSTVSKNSKQKTSSGKTSKAASGGAKNSSASKKAADTGNAGGEKTPKSPAAGTAFSATPDLLVFSEPTPGNYDSIEEKQRIIGMLDLPRPEMLVNVWSVQISSKDEQAVASSRGDVRTKVGEFNDRLEEAVLKGWECIKTAAANPDSFYDEAFYKYLVYRYVADADAPGSGNTIRARSQALLDNKTGVKLPENVRAQLGICSADQYCLGYRELFHPLKPRLMDLLLAVISAKDPPKAIEEALLRMDGGVIPERKESCEITDWKAYTDEKHRGPFFECFRTAANAYLRSDGTSPHPIGLLRSAVANFLFHYKFAYQFPHDFSAYDLDHSAQSLNAAMNPLMQAFNRDIQVYQKVLMDGLVTEPHSNSRMPWFGAEDKRSSFTNNGLVAVRAISGKETIVDTATQSYIDATTAPTIPQVLSSITQAEGSVPGVIGNNLSASAAAALTGALNSMQSSESKIGRGVKVDLVPRSLPGASSAEIEVSLNVEETAEPTLYSGGQASGANDNLSRVAKHDTTTNMRIDSLKIFEVSSLAAQVQRSRVRFPLLPLPGLEVPYIGSFVGIPRKPAAEYHSSVAVLSAIVVPTAADLAYGTRFERDKIVESDESTDGDTSNLKHYTFRSPIEKGDFENIVDFNAAMVNCFATGLTTPVLVWGQRAPASTGACKDLKISQVPRDAR